MSFTKSINAGIHFLATGRALPKKKVTNDDLSKIVDTNDEWIRTRTGIGQRYLCEEESCMSLAIEAAKKAVSKIDDKSQIGYVIVATTTPDYAFPSVACMVKEALELDDDVMSYDLSAACSGFLYSIETARGLLMAGDKKYALIVGSEQMSRITDFTDRSTCVLFGDGAGAAVVTLDDSKYAHIAKSRGDDKALYCSAVGNKEMYIHMEGNQVFKFAVSVIAEGVEEVLKKANLTMDDIDYVVCHQANERIIDHVRKKYAGNEDKFYKNIASYANTSAASIPIALDEMFEKEMLKPGMKIITVGFGAGFTWSSALITI